MVNKIQESYGEFKLLIQGSLCDFAIINWWLLKYEDLYRYVVRTYKRACVKCLELAQENLPYDCLRKPDYCNKKPEYQKFITLYDELMDYIS